MGKKNSIIKGALKKAVHPKHLWRAIKIQRTKGEQRRAYDDPQLKLIAKLCPGDFLNYGHFENTDVEPRDISINNILVAQTRNAELVLDLIHDSASPILDVGCGLGGMTRMMIERGLNPTALTPNNYQIRKLKEAYPKLRLIESKFEDIPVEEYRHEFGTIITSESLQYLKLDLAVPLMGELLRQGGRWIACDWFRVGKLGDRSGHVWTSFETQLGQKGWKITYNRDHTKNVLPLLRHIYMLGNDLLRPTAEFAFEKLREKQPGLRYLLDEVIEELMRRGDKNLDVINPQLFAANKKYLLLVMERI
jgi:SAM-dependent methyltransferase